MKIVRVVACAACVIAGIVGCQSVSNKRSISMYMEDSMLRIFPTLLESAVSDPALTSKDPFIMRQGWIKNETTLISNECVEKLASQFAGGLSSSGLVRFVPSDGSMQGGRSLTPTAAWVGKLVQKDGTAKDGRSWHEVTLTISIVDIATGERLWRDERCVRIEHK